MQKTEEHNERVPTTIKNLKALIGLLLVVIITSCTESKIYDKYLPIEKQLWYASDGLKFNVITSDTISQNNVFINIRSNKDYQFSSLFLIGKIKFPSGLQVADTLEYEMTDAQGKWLGSGFSDLKENKLFYKENVVFSETGSYTFEIHHATRGIDDIEGVKPLRGIVDVGISIEKIKK